MVDPNEDFGEGNVVASSFERLVPLPDAIELARAVIGVRAHGRWADITGCFLMTRCAGRTEDGLAEAWAYLAGLAGAYESDGDIDALRAGDFTITNTPRAFEAGDFVARVTFRDDRTIAGLYIPNPDSAGGAHQHWVAVTRSGVGEEYFWPSADQESAP